MPMLPYAAIFPDKNEPIITMAFDRKQGRIPKGSYGFMEFYCDEKCDCRRVIIVILNQKLKEKAVISMGFDLAEPMAGPFLDTSQPQSSCADELLECFVEMLNDEPDFLRMFYTHYREVREQVEGKPYRGKAFPNPKKTKRSITTAETLSDSFPDFMETLVAAVNTPPMPGRKGKGRGKQAPSQNLHLFLERYLGFSKKTKHAELGVVQDDLRCYLLQHENAGEEISALLVALCAASFEDDAKIEAALRLLSDILEILRIELERGRAGSSERMAEVQSALARDIFLEFADADLCAAVSHVLLQSRVELLPVLHEANQQRMEAEAEDVNVQEMSAGYALEGLFKSIEEMGHESPFAALEAILQFLALGPVEMQIALGGEMLAADSPLVRDTAALMILHPTSPEVRLAVSEFLVAHGKKMTPETLRRLIISRNWFPEDMRHNIDEAISNARRGRVDCAPMPRNLGVTVYASVVDGGGAQSILTIVPEGKGFKNCSVLLKFGFGVADAFVVPLPSKRDLRAFLDMVDKGAGFIESSLEYLDRRVCHGLAEGTAQGKAPNYWLLQVAEVLGREQWRAAPLDAVQELAALRQELAGSAPDLLTVKARAKALQDSGDWTERHTFADSWFEDNAEVDRVIEAVLKKSGKKRPDESKIIAAILKNILEKKRPVWLKRLTLSALWLKSSPKPPVPWHQMFHLAEALADEKQALADIPLMKAIAFHSLGAFLARQEEARR